MPLGLLPVVFGPADDAEIVERFDEIGIEREGAAIGRRGGLVVAVGLVQVAEIVPGPGLAREGLEGQIDEAQPLGAAPGLVQEKAEIVPRVRIRRRRIEHGPIEALGRREAGLAVEPHGQRQALAPRHLQAQRALRGEHRADAVRCLLLVGVEMLGERPSVGRGEDDAQVGLAGRRGSARGRSWNGGAARQGGPGEVKG